MTWAGSWPTTISFKKAPVAPIDHIEALAVPFRLIDLLLIVTRPHIVAVIHLLGGKRNFSLDLPLY